MAASEQIANAITYARAHPVPVIGAGALAVGFVLARKVSGQGGEAQDDTRESPAMALSDEYAPAQPGSTLPPVSGDGKSPITTGNPSNSNGTTPFPTPGATIDPNKPGPIKSQALRITAADRAAYSCDGDRYLRYGRGENRNKIVCVDRQTRRESGVIVNPTKR